MLQPNYIETADVFLHMSTQTFRNDYTDKA